MAVDHLQFLKERFITEFKEAADEFGAELPLCLRFEDILNVLQGKTIDDSTPIELKNSLYNLLYLLANCVLSAEKERKRKSQKKKIHVNARALKTCWFTRKTRKKLGRIRKKLQHTNNAENSETSLQPDSITAHRVQNINQPPLEETHGFATHLQKMKAFLEMTPDNHGGIKAVGIVGMCGVGKTTLARQFFRDFSPVIWVTLSLKANPKEIVTHLLRHLGAKDDEFQDHDRQLSELHNRLFGRKYLIVLDNVVHVNEWYSNLSSNQSKDEGTSEGASKGSHFCHGLPKRDGGAIIVTTPLEEVALSMVGENYLLRLEPNCNEEALWSIFMDSICRKRFIAKDHHRILSRMKDEIVYRCEGLPLAAKTLAEVISVQLGKQEYWANSDVRKDFCLKLDLPDIFLIRNVLMKVRALPGIHGVFLGPGDDSDNYRKLPCYRSREGSGEVVPHRAHLSILGTK